MTAIKHTSTLLGCALGTFAVSQLALAGPGCVMVGPDYEEPPAPLESDWLDYEDPRLDSVSPLAPEWWRAAFEDATLDRLIEMRDADVRAPLIGGPMLARTQLAQIAGDLKRSFIISEC